MLHSAQLTRAEDLVLDKVTLEPVGKASSLFEKGTVVILCISFLLAGERFASRIDADKELDDVAELPVNLDHWKFIACNQVMETSPLQQCPIDHLFGFCTGQMGTRADPT